MVGTSFGGQWTQEKLDILHRYLEAYTTALKDQPFRLIYVDAFAGEGYYEPKSAGFDEDYSEFRELVKGSAAIALDVDDKPFDEPIFVESDQDRIRSLEKMAGEYPMREIKIIQGDANIEIPIFCENMKTSDRAVVFLDPFGPEVSWGTVATLAETEKIDCWILFPLNRVVRDMPVTAEPPVDRAEELDRVFGGRSYWQQTYQPSLQLSMLDEAPSLERPRGTEEIVNLYRERLESVFPRVAPTPRTLRNSRNAPLFELFFAVSNPAGAPIAVRIADHILSNW